MKNMRDVEIQDFGQKIGGARKDLATKKGLLIDAISDLGNKELLTFVTKDRVWTKPNFNSLEYSSYEPDYLLFLHYLRYQMPSKMDARTFLQIESIVGDVRSNSLLTSFSRLYLIILQSTREFFEDQKVYEGIKKLKSTRGIIEKGVSEELIEIYNSLHKDIFSTENMAKLNLPDFVLDIKVNGSNRVLGNSSTFEKIQLNVNVVLDSGGTETNKRYSLASGTSKFDCLFNYLKGYNEIEVKLHDFPKNFDNKLKNARFYIGVQKNEQGKELMYYQVSSNKIGFIKTVPGESVESLVSKFNNRIAKIEVNKAKEEKELEDTEGLLKVKRPQVDGVKRTVPAILRRPVEEKDYLEKFKLYGGEFGNWNNQKDRQMFLNYGYEAFADLAFVLNTKPEFIGLPQIDSIAKGEGYKDLIKAQPKYRPLSIAFGSRGKSSALAHFELERKVINLTKLKGAGSLAHEYGHALDAHLLNILVLELESLIEQANKDNSMLAYSNIPYIKNIINSAKGVGMMTNFYRISNIRLIEILDSLSEESRIISVINRLGYQMMSLIHISFYQNLSFIERIKSSMKDALFRKKHKSVKSFLVLSLLSTLTSEDQRKLIKKDMDFNSYKVLIDKILLDAEAEDSEEVQAELDLLVKIFEERLLYLIDNIDLDTLSNYDTSNLFLASCNSWDLIIEHRPDILDGIPYTKVEDTQLDYTTRENIKHQMKERMMHKVIQAKQDFYRTILKEEKLFQSLSDTRDKLPVINSLFEKYATLELNSGSPQTGYANRIYSEIDKSTVDVSQIGLLEKVTGCDLIGEIYSKIIKSLTSVTREGVYYSTIVEGLAKRTLKIDRNIFSEKIDFNFNSDDVLSNFKKMNRKDVSRHFKTYFYSCLGFFHDSAYLASRHEVFARLFECYVENALEKKSMESNYLVYGTKDKNKIDKRSLIKYGIYSTINKNELAHISVYPIDPDEKSEIMYAMQCFINELPKLDEFYTGRSLFGFEFEQVTLAEDGEYNKALNEDMQATGYVSTLYRKVSNAKDFQTALQNYVIAKTNGEETFDVEKFIRLLENKTKKVIKVKKYKAIPESKLFFLSQAGFVDSNSEKRSWNICLDNSKDDSKKREGLLEYTTLLLLNGSIPSLQEKIDRDNLGNFRSLFMFAFGFFFEKSSEKRYSTEIGLRQMDSTTESLYKELINNNTFKLLLYLVKNASKA